MWKYVSRRVKDTIELGINVRKSFTIQQSLNNSSSQQQQQNEKFQNSLRYHQIVPRHQDPSWRERAGSDGKFKQKYHKLNEHRCFLNALTWSTAIITGFYASQLLCLYRRNQRLAVEGTKGCYSKYLLSTTQSIHRNVQYLLTAEGQKSFLPSIKSFGCPFKKARTERGRQPKPSRRNRSVEDEFKDFKHFVDPGYNQHERYERFETPSGSNNFRSTNVYNVTNDAKGIKFIEEPSVKVEAPARELTPEEIEDAAIDGAIRNLAKIVGELEFQLGVESVNNGDYNKAVNHFKLSYNHNHPGGVFNLALCYERGVGVKRNMKTAKKLYEIASELGHAKAFYNLGVFHAQGLGGGRKNFKEAKECFEKAADLGNADAMDALSLLIPVTKRLPVLEEFPVEDFYFKNKVMSNAVSAISNFGRVAVI